MTAPAKGAATTPTSPVNLPDQQTQASSGASSQRPGVKVTGRFGAETATAAFASNKMREAAAVIAQGAELAKQKRAEAKEGKAQAAKLQQWSDGIRQLEDEALAASMRNAQNVQKLGAMVGSFRPRPGRLFQDGSSAAMWGAAMSLAASTFQSARSGGANGAMQIIQTAIQQDLAAQELIYDAKKSELQSAQTLYTQMRASYGDAIVARQAQRAALLEAAKMRVTAAGAPHAGAAAFREKEALAHSLNAAGNEALIKMAEKEYTIQSFSRAKDLGPSLLKLLPRDLQQQLLENSGQADLATLYGISSEAAQQLLEQAQIQEDESTAMDAAVDAEVSALQRRIDSSAKARPATGTRPRGAAPAQAEVTTAPAYSREDRAAAARTFLEGLSEEERAKFAPEGAGPEITDEMVINVMESMGPSESVAVEEDVAGFADPGRGDSTARADNLEAAEDLVKGLDAVVTNTDQDILNDEEYAAVRESLLKGEPPQGRLLEEAASALESGGFTDLAQKMRSLAPVMTDEQQAAFSAAEDEARTAAIQGRRDQLVAANPEQAAESQRLIRELESTGTSSGAMASGWTKKLAEMNATNPIVSQQMRSLLPSSFSRTGEETGSAWKAPLQTGASESEASDKIRAQMNFVRQLGGALNIERGTAVGDSIWDRAVALGQRGFLSGVDTTVAGERGKTLLARRNVQQIKKSEVPVAFMRKLDKDGNLIDDAADIRKALEGAGVDAVELEKGWMQETVRVPKFVEVDRTVDGVTTKVTVQQGTTTGTVNVPVYFVQNVRSHAPPEKNDYQFGVQQDKAVDDILTGRQRVWKAGLSEAERTKFRTRMTRARELRQWSKSMLLFAGMRKTLGQAFGEMLEGKVDLDRDELVAAVQSGIALSDQTTLGRLSQEEKRDLMEAARSGDPSKSKVLQGLLAKDGDTYELSSAGLQGGKGTISHFYGFMAPQKAELGLVNKSTGLPEDEWWSIPAYLKRNATKTGASALQFVGDLEKRLQATYDVYTTTGVGAQEAYDLTLKAMQGKKLPGSIYDTRAGEVK